MTPAQHAPHRKQMPIERKALTHRFTIRDADSEGLPRENKFYLTVGMFEDGSPGEIWIKMSKEGSALSGMLRGFSICASMCLQYGVPLKAMIRKFSHMKFEPEGFTGNIVLPCADSVLDYVFRFMQMRFEPKEVPQKMSGV